MSKKIPTIVIVGGGAGGLELTALLGDRLGKHQQADIVLVNDTLTHIWKPLLHEVAAGTLDSHEDELSYVALAHTHHFSFELGNLQNIDRASQTISVAFLNSITQKVQVKQISYDILVLAVGSITHDFNTPGAKEYCYFLDTAKQAEVLQKAYLLAFMQPQERLPLELVIIGGGATGVELAAELYFAAEQFHKYKLTAKAKHAIHITIIEAGKRLLSALPEHISNTVLKEFSEKNITVLTQQKVSEITKEGVYVGKEFIPADFSIWCAGIRCADFLKNIGGLATNATNQIIVNEYCQTPSDKNIFAIGDCAAFTLPDEKLAPPRAQTAHQQARLLAKSINLLIKNNKLKLFKFQEYGSIISLSRHTAVGEIIAQKNFRLSLEGKLARGVYIALYKQHLAILLGWWKTLLLSFSRWLTKSVKLRLKLH